MRAQISALLVLCVAGVLSKAVDHPNLNLLPPRGKCGVQVGTYPAPPSDGSGSAAGLTESPWLALLQYSKLSSTGALRHSCSGVLISDRYVLTGAHCVTGNAKKSIGDVSRVRLGEYNEKIEKDCVQENGAELCADAVQDLEVESLIVHPDYNENNISHHNDIALIRLKNAVSYTDYIKPICLPLGDEQTAPGQNLLLSGWDRDNKDESNNLKQKASLPFIASSDCQTKYQTAKIQLWEGQMCAGGLQGVHSCIALGGSPLTATFPGTTDRYVEGIVSFGPAICANGGLPDVFSRVANYVPWILDNIKP